MKLVGGVIAVLFVALVVLATFGCTIKTGSTTFSFLDQWSPRPRAGVETITNRTTVGEGINTTETK